MSLSFDVSEGTGDVVLIRCDLCARHEGKLRALRNFSASFVKGITGNAPEERQRSETRKI